MKKYTLTTKSTRVAVLLGVALLYAGQAISQVKIGGDVTNINPSALFELDSKTKGLLLPQMTEGEMRAIQNPAVGLTVFCTTCTTPSLCNFDGTSWINLTDGTTYSAVVITPDCSADGFQGNAVENVNINGSSFSVTVTATAGSGDVDFSTNDLSFLGIPNNIIVTSVDITSVTLNQGESQKVTYNLWGSATSTGNLMVNWTNAALGLSCQRTVTFIPDAISVALSTNQAAYNGASVDEAIVITEAEYNNIANTVPGAIRSGSPTTIMNMDATRASNFVFQVTGPSGNTGIPQGSYLIAIWTKGGSAESAGDYWLWATSGATNCSRIRWKSGHLGSGTNTNNYWAIKKPTLPSPYANSAILLGDSGGNVLIDIADYSGLWAQNYIDDSCVTGNNVSSYNFPGVQAITTPQRSW